MRTLDERATVSTTLTVFFDGQFWVGVAERRSAGGVEACRIVFGAEPTNEEIYQLVLKKWATLSFSSAVEDATMRRKNGNPKRRQRAAAREAARARPSTKAQEALAVMRESRKDARHAHQAALRQADKQERYEQKQAKRHRKRKGH
ncbi:YjdF family protein [Collinsella sp. An2]|uniref:YjdF family protein n=1 Tax=Collinsella sp. An2 TaxID=1965585 RepID=UPI00130268CB|nr:YjdF family protein [Collinsella sp. An2]